MRMGRTASSSVRFDLECVGAARACKSDPHADETAMVWPAARLNRRCDFRFRIASFASGFSRRTRTFADRSNRADWSVMILQHKPIAPN